MTTKGKLFFDFTTPAPPAGTHWDEATLKLMHDAVEAAINLEDGWNYGYCVRNKWLNLWDVPSNHGAMAAYCTTKLADLPNHVFEAVEDPPQPIAYCYSGDQRICYHPHVIELDGAKWTVTVSVQGKPYKLYIVIVLTYETVCFS